MNYNQWEQWEQWQQWNEWDQQAVNNKQQWQQWKQFQECEEQVEERGECKEQFDEMKECVKQIEEIEECMKQIEDITQMDRNIRVEQRIISDNMNPFTAMTDTEFIDRFCLRKESVNTIIQEIQEVLPVLHDKRDCPVPPYHQVLVSIVYMTSESFQARIANCYNVSQTYVSRCVERVAKAIAQQRQHYIKFPSRKDLNSVMVDFSEIAGMPEIIGCIGSTHIKILRPSCTDYESFKCKEGFYSLNVQAICGSDLQFYNIVRWPGSFQNSKIFLKSRIHGKLQDGVLPGYLLGGNEYPCRSFLLTPLASPNSPQERAYNNSHTYAMNTIKRAFCVLKHRFKRLGTTIKTNIETTKAIIVAATVLHNIAIKTRLELQEENLDVHINRSHIENDVHSNRLVNDHDDDAIDNNSEEALQGSLKRTQLIRDCFNTEGMKQ